MCFDLTLCNASGPEKAIFRKIFAARQYQAEQNQNRPSLRRTLRSSILPGAKRRGSGLRLFADGFRLGGDDAAAPTTDAGPQPVAQPLVQGGREVPDHTTVKDVQEVRSKLFYKPNNVGEPVGNKVQPLPAPYSPSSEDSVSEFTQDIDIEQSRDVL
jgi:hypothetical protein